MKWSIKEGEIQKTKENSYKYCRYFPIISEGVICMKHGIKAYKKVLLSKDKYWIQAIMADTKNKVRINK